MKIPPYPPFGKEGWGIFILKRGKGMTAKLISGSDIARQIREELKEETA